MKHLNNQRVRGLQEAVGSIRNLILDSTHQVYIDEYSKLDRRQRKLESKNMFYSAYPKFAIEALGIIFISLLGGFLVITDNSPSDVLALLAVVALGSQRILPCFQQIYSGLANLKSWNASLNEVLYLLDQPVPKAYKNPSPMNIENSIILENICFRYDEVQPLTIKSVSLEIKRGETIGFIGTTGSGKSTLVDLIMGILPLKVEDWLSMVMICIIPIIRLSCLSGEHLSQMFHSLYSLVMLHLPKI